MEHQQFETRGDYLTTQITASAGKADYCKVSYRDVQRYVDIIGMDKHRRREAPGSTGPTLCLGVRNGREVDLFRIAQSGSRFAHVAGVGLTFVLVAIGWVPFMSTDLTRSLKLLKALLGLS